MDHDIPKILTCASSFNEEEGLESFLHLEYQIGREQSVNPWLPNCERFSNFQKNVKFTDMNSKKRPGIIPGTAL
jgi:hypothetical protein